MAQIQNVHQMQVAAAEENSIGNEVAALQRALREWGFESEIYAAEVAPSMRGRAHHFSGYRPSPHDLVILHYSTASQVNAFLQSQRVPLVLMYHNVTPPRFLVGLAGGERERAHRALDAVTSLREQTVVAVGRSAFSRQELVDLGFNPVRELPVVVPDLLSRVEPDPAVWGRFGADGQMNLLFVGRIVPNKRQEDLIKLLYYVRRTNEDARLLLVGSWGNSRRYADWLRQFAQRLGLADAVYLCGHVTNRELAAYYHVADVYVSMSEHEGFGIPLVEAMRFGVPIVAYACTAVPGTLGGAGILIKQKTLPVIAELLQLLHKDADLRGRIVEGQHERQRVFDEEVVLQGFRAILDSAIRQLSNE
jgi:glycosyltransferase involved in cell wall biosynthesis